MNNMNSRVYTSEFSIGNKLARVAWGIVYVLLFRMSLRPMHMWRIFLLRIFGAKVGDQVKIYESARIWAPWNLTIGDGAILGDRVDCYSVAEIFVGAYAVISQDSCLCAATHDHRSDAFTLISKPIVIKENAWIAARAFVGPGVVVGKHSVVGACAVVFKDVIDGGMAVGNPAKIVELDTDK